MANEERRTATRRRPGRLLARRGRSTVSLWLLFLRGTMCYQASFLLPLHPPLAKHEVMAVLRNCYACCFSGASGRVLSCAVHPGPLSVKLHPLTQRRRLSSRAFSFSTAYAKYGSLMQLEVAAGDREREGGGRDGEGGRRGCGGGEAGTNWAHGRTRSMTGRRARAG